MKRHLSFLSDTSYERRDEAAMDVDRFINEGMAGGSVFRYGQRTNIEEARDLESEAPPAD
ncbi:hypothetical protein JMA_13250 [Jeotgalibacillus malaysiensis]|uniref:Uncharacterized protein n=1 Tax=Jeotgalibacillus malaysiensis TaxID=1508404 RepID=A0A0B5APP6_9BACL|nr:hypothetical protein [Jeotgalibacillus malaysiensis]AJD90642.1 hypothetical protein JMA_13250 [Jeotgalibacillus malaysiensis]